MKECTCAVVEGENPRPHDLSCPRVRAVASPSRDLGGCDTSRDLRVYDPEVMQRAIDAATQSEHAPFDDRASVLEQRAREVVDAWAGVAKFIEDSTAPSVPMTGTERAQWRTLLTHLLATGVAVAALNAELER